MNRLFIAVELGAEMKGTLGDALAQLRACGVKGRYEEVRNLHITLAFIGETERLADIKEAMTQIAVEPFEISLNGIGCFPKHGVLWMGLSNERRLEALAAEVRRRLDEIGVAYAATPFKPHITLVKDADISEPDMDVVPAKMTVNRISVMETTWPGGKRTYIGR